MPGLRDTFELVVRPQLSPDRALRLLRSSSLATATGGSRAGAGSAGDPRAYNSAGDPRACNTCNTSDTSATRTQGDAAVEEQETHLHHAHHTHMLLTKPLCLYAAGNTPLSRSLHCYAAN